MDYQESNSINGEIEEPFEKPAPTKAGKITRKVFKYLFFFIIALAWVLILTSIIVRRSHPILETPILSDEARAAYLADKDAFSMYDVFTEVFMSTDGSIQLAETVYTDTAHELETGVRIAWTQLRYCHECDTVYTTMQLMEQEKLDKENAKQDSSYKPVACTAVHNVSRCTDRDESLYITLTDSTGKTFEQVGCVKRIKKLPIPFLPLKYEYARISFGGLYFDLSRNIINREPDTDTDTSTDENPDAPAGTGYQLDFYDKPGGNLLFSTRIYDDDTYISEAEYELPDSEYTRSQS